MSRTRRYVVTVGGASPRAVELNFNDTSQSWTAKADGKEVSVRLDEVAPDGAIRVEIDGEVINLRMATGEQGETLLAPLRSDGGVGVPVRVRSDGDVILGAASGPSEPPTADPEVKAPIMMRNSPTKPLRPGSPAEARATKTKTVVYLGTVAAMPPYSAMTRVCRRS